jgi:hypothetical protein
MGAFVRLSLSLSPFSGGCGGSAGIPNSLSSAATTPRGSIASMNSSLACSDSRAGYVRILWSCVPFGDCVGKYVAWRLVDRFTDGRGASICNGLIPASASLPSDSMVWVSDLCQSAPPFVLGLGGSEAMEATGAEDVLAGDDKIDLAISSSRIFFLRIAKSFSDIFTLCNGGGGDGGR